MKIRKYCRNSGRDRRFYKEFKVGKTMTKSGCGDEEPMSGKEGASSDMGILLLLTSQLPETLN